MRLRLLTVPAALAAAVLAAGCTSAPSNDAAGDYQGTEKEIAEVVDDLSAAAVDGDSKEICDTIFAPELADRLTQDGSDCQDALDDQLSDVTDGDIDVTSIDVTGDRATAQVVSPFAGDDRQQTLSFVRDGNAWRISGLEPAS
ncbi:MAG TPA: hypothetical protein VFR97_06800 [Capillimicrobium sp.]|nr:hypothetical protein [Capillimicrobium sp.]